jgi:hypothetical protein
MASSAYSVALVADEPELAAQLRSALTSGRLDCTIEVQSLEQLASHHAAESIGVLVLRLGA